MNEVLEMLAESTKETYQAAKSNDNTNFYGGLVNISGALNLLSVSEIDISCVDDSLSSFIDVIEFISLSIDKCERGIYVSTIHNFIYELDEADIFCFMKNWDHFMNIVRGEDAN